MSNSQPITPPLAAHFVWHPDDQESIFPVISAFRRYLTRDIDRPFSRELNIPTFLYSSRRPKKPPQNLPLKSAAKNVIFLFTSSSTLINDKWRNYINLIPNETGVYIVPIAIDHNALNHSGNGSLEKLNFIRAFDWPSELRKEYAILALSHELYRFGLKDVDPTKQGIESSIKLFLSHAKKGDTGLRHAEAIKRFLDNSNMQRFFDANEISPAFRFDEEIEKHIKNSTVIAITSDAYSSRYWCQREILCAKRERRPIIVVNSLEHYEDRIFPAAANVPCVHVTAEELKEADILRILIAALLETIRFEHAHQQLQYYKVQGWIDSQAEIFARPPELQQLVDLVEKKNSEKLEYLHVCYPEPPLYKEETNWTDHFSISISTPLWSTKEKDSANLRIGLSISDYETDGYESHHQDLDELKRFSQTLARHLLARENTLIYGGDLRDDGFTQFILEEAAILRDRLQVERLFVENHLAWPIYTDAKSKIWAANYFNVLKITEHTIPEDVKNNISDSNTFLKPDCPENKYIWSRCLTEMRRNSVGSSDARIFAGGKLAGYLGKIPGVLEEFLFAYEQNKAIYLAGGLGGLTSLLCSAIMNKQNVEQFSEEWQIAHNVGYSDLQKIAAQYGNSANYNEIASTIDCIEISELAKSSGLSEVDYICLMRTPFVDECVHLILKGLKGLKAINQEGHNGKA